MDSFSRLQPMTRKTKKAPKNDSCDVALLSCCVSVPLRVYILFASGENAEDFVAEAATRITNVLAYVQDHFAPVAISELPVKEGIVVASRSGVWVRLATSELES